MADNDINKNNPQNFSDLMSDIIPIKQDKLHFNFPVKNKTQVNHKINQLEADVFFSDDYQPILPFEGPMKWVSDPINAFKLKRLRRGDYLPDFLLDLHGMRQSEAKLEISALINACIKSNSHCCCIMHGHGMGILKQQVPIWLTQHPKIIAFHQATKEWGGNAALLVLIELDDNNRKS